MTDCIVTAGYIHSLPSPLPGQQRMTWPWSSKCIPLATVEIGSRIFICLPMILSKMRKHYQILGVKFMTQNMAGCVAGGSKLLHQQLQKKNSSSPITLCYKLSPSYPQVKAVTSLVIRQHFRRCLTPLSVGRPLNTFDHLEQVTWEPWVPYDVFFQEKSMKNVSTLNSYFSNVKCTTDNYWWLRLW